MPCQLGITSMSLGWASAGHKLEAKLSLAHVYGYKGIELFHDDLDDLAARKFERTSPIQKSDPVCRSSHQAQLDAAHYVRQLCDTLDIFIICLQPFAGYEGLLDRQVQEEKIAKLHRWIELAHVLKTDIIQIPSSFEPAAKMTTDLDRIASDLQRVADIGAAANPPLRFVFEALCWGTRVNLWEESWEIVKQVDRPNFGLCLDSFNIAGRIYADPASASGTTPNADAAVAASMRKLVAEVDVRKVFYVQIVDAERLAGGPLVAGHDFYRAEQPARMSWSRNCRLFYGEAERRAYLPVRRIAEAFFRGLGFEGWVSLELFNRRMSDEDAGVAEELARRGAASWHKLVRDFDLLAVVVEEEEEREQPPHPSHQICVPAEIHPSGPEAQAQAPGAATTAATTPNMRRMVSAA